MRHTGRLTITLPGIWMTLRRLIVGDGKVSKIIRKKDDIILTRDDCDISSLDSVRSAVKGFSGVIINCAAKTNLDWCAVNMDEAFRVNTLGPINLLKASEENGCKLVHISTGCIFDGNDRVVDECDTPNSSVWYSKTKAYADDYITSYGYSPHLILRPRQMISSTVDRTNMITKFLSLQSIRCHDKDNSITCTEDFGLMIDHLLKIDASGVYNCVNDGTISPYEIAKMIKDYLNPGMVVEKISYEEMLSMMPEKRVNVIMSTSKLRASGFNPRPARDALAWCLDNYG